MKRVFICAMSLAMVLCAGCAASQPSSSGETTQAADGSAASKDVTPSYVTPEHVDVGESVQPGTALVNGQLETYTTEEGAKAAQEKAFSGEAVNGDELSSYVRAPSVEGKLTLETTLVDLMRLRDEKNDEDKKSVNISLSGSWSGGKPTANPSSSYGVVASDSALPEISINGVTLKPSISYLAVSGMSGTYAYSGEIPIDVDTVEVKIGDVTSKVKKEDTDKLDSSTGVISGRPEKMGDTVTMQSFCDKIANRIARRVFSWTKFGS
jgi:hypothetical protein